jgi:vesicle-associated membrane protein 7
MPPREYGPAIGLNSNQAYKADPIGKVQAQVDQVKITMRENVEVMVTNMERTAQLEDKSAALATQARAFHSTSKATRRHMWCQLLKQRMLLGGVCLTVVIILILCIAGSNGAFNSK